MNKELLRMVLRSSFYICFNQQTEPDAEVI